MNRPKPPALLLINLVSLALAIACSGSLSTPLGPTGSDTSNSTSGDTTIRGRATSGRSTSSLRSTLASGPSSKVCVTGTNHCQNVDSNGQFEIKGNFVGDVHLTFMTPQGNTDVTVPGVVAGETLVVDVLLAGASATVTIQSRQGGNNGNNNAAAAVDDDSDDDSEDSDDESEDDDSEDDDSDDDSEDDDSEDDDSEDDDSGPSGSSGSGNRGRH